MGTALLTGLLLLAGCGGGGGSGGSGPDPTPPVVTPPVVTPPTVTAPALPASGTAVAFASATDDTVGKGKTLNYTQATARIDASRQNQLVQVDIYGDERWTAQFNLAPRTATLQTGEYKDLVDAFDPAIGTTGWFAWNAGAAPASCPQRRSNLTIERASFDGDTLTELSFSFEQWCSPSAGPMRGRVRWLAADKTRGPGPAQPLPANLWAPATGSTPATGNYIYLESATGDPIGGGRNTLHTQVDSRIVATLAGPSLNFVVQGDSRWFGRFRAMDSLTRLQPGYYGELRSFLNINPRRGGFDWMAPTERCEDRTRGWFVVDNVQYRGDVMSLVELRFEQRCADGSGPPLHGKIRWSVDEVARPTGPSLPVPAGLWQAPTQGLPANGNYVYLEGEAGEFISQGKTTLITPADLPLTVFDDSGALKVRVGDLPGEWGGEFKADFSRRQLERGYYGSLQSAAFGNPAKGGITWGGQGRGCETSGWFVIDDIAYTYGELRQIDLRFEQLCNGKRMHGRIKWASADPVVLENRIDPPSQAAPMPASATPPASGSYVLLDGGADDFISLGGLYLHTLANSRIGVELVGDQLVVTVQGEQQWRGEFSPASSPGTITVPAMPPVNGQARMRWSGEGRGCNIAGGSFTIDKLQNSANGVLALDLRFEQYCDEGFTPLRGTVHWVANDATRPPGPVLPVPQDLWRLPASQVPGSGNYFYVHSAPGSFVGEGRNHAKTAADSEFILTPADGGLSIRVHGQDLWLLELRPMLPLTRLQPGYYGPLRRVIAMNPARGGLDVTGISRGCNTLTGWFSVDAVSYAGDQLTGLDLRLLQLCEDKGPPLYAQLRWRR